MTTDTNQLVNTAQEAAIIDVKETLASKQGVLREIGKIEAFEFINKLATVATLKLLVKVKETKEYVGLTYTLENGQLATVANWEDFCNQILHSPKRTIDDRLLNLNTFGEEFFEASQRIGLGNRELRKLRQLPAETQELIINNESVDLGDKEAVKELIEDFTFKHVTEKAELQKQVEEANQTVKAIRANSDEKQKQLDDIKELEAKRRFSQEPWKAIVLDSAKGMLSARVKLDEAINQLKDIFENFKTLGFELDDKAVNLIARSLMAEANIANDLVTEFTNDVFGVLGGTCEADLDAGDIYQEYELGITTTDESTTQADITE